jgi:hypothetical protein
MFLDPYKNDNDDNYDDNYDDDYYHNYEPINTTPPCQFPPVHILDVIYNEQFCVKDIKTASNFNVNIINRFYNEGVLSCKTIIVKIDVNSYYVESTVEIDNETFVFISKTKTRK